jgi:S-adenosylmethionine hydrolase
MKGVILARCPEATIIDICHFVPAFSVLPGAYTIGQAAPYFPKGTFHVIVVDPGVGTSRRAIVAEALGQVFIGPDNGVLSLILRRDPSPTVRELRNTDLFLEHISSTFHGRDIFSPAAATLASGRISLQDAGPVISDVQVLHYVEPVETEPNIWRGVVLSIDYFGNVITNFPAARFKPGTVRIHTAGCKIGTFHQTFGESAPDELFLYIGSSGLIEIGMNQASAASSLNLQPGATLDLMVLK